MHNIVVHTMVQNTTTDDGRIKAKRFNAGVSAASLTEGDRAGPKLVGRKLLATVSPGDD